MASLSRSCNLLHFNLELQLHFWHNLLEDDLFPHSLNEEVIYIDICNDLNSTVSLKVYILLVLYITYNLFTLSIFFSI
jgi:hypothetical protein